MVILNRYVGESAPDAVLVGSSLTYRLSEAYFSTMRVRNLALPGGSPVTGLEVVATRPSLPKFVLVETNVLSRPVDEDLVRKYSNVTDMGPMFLRPIKAAVAAYENWLHASPSNLQIALSLDRLLNEPPSDFDNRGYLKRALQEANSEDPEPATKKNVEEIKSLVASIEYRGPKVLLFELPHAPEIEAAKFARVTRSIVHAAFPDSTRWLRMKVPREELRWPDGVHLDERSALLIARSIEQGLSVGKKH